MPFPDGEHVWLNAAWYHPTHGRLRTGSSGIVAATLASGSVDVIFDDTDDVPVLTDPKVLVAARDCPNGHGPMRVQVHVRSLEEFEAAGIQPDPFQHTEILWHRCVICRYTVDERHRPTRRPSLSQPVLTTPAKAAVDAAVVTAETHSAGVGTHRSRSGPGPRELLPPRLARATATSRAGCADVVGGEALGIASPPTLPLRPTPRTCGGS